MKDLPFFVIVVGGTALALLIGGILVESVDSLRHWLAERRGLLKDRAQTKILS